jgi:hypothetical protein
MILLRDVFQLKFGKAREVHGETRSRAMVDLTGEFYTFVTEATYDSLAAFEKALKDVTARSEFRTWYQKFVPLVESGRHESYTVVK